MQAERPEPKLYRKPKPLKLGHNEMGLSTYLTCPETLYPYALPTMPQDLCVSRLPPHRVVGRALG